MQLFAQVNNHGTAMAETAVCRVHHATHRLHFEVDRDYVEDKRVPLSDPSWHDCTGNDALSCNVCGVTSETPDLIGKTIAGMEFVKEYFSEDSFSPQTILHFSDGTTHTFTHESQQD